MSGADRIPEDREQMRAQERAVWTEVEQLGRQLRADPARQAATQAEQDAPAKPREAFGV